MNLDKGALARIDRKILAGLGDDEALRTLRVPATGAKWATWKRYCDAAGVSMGRAVTALIDRELLSVFGEHAADESPVLAQQATEELQSREDRVGEREHKVDTDQLGIHRPNGACNTTHIMPPSRICAIGRGDCIMSIKDE